MTGKLDYLIANATVVDGSGNEPFAGHVGIRHNKIAVVSREKITTPARQVIDAAGRYLTPGFIDTHASTGFGFFFPHAADHKLYQGITTEIFGNCGTSPAPIGPLLTEKMQSLAGALGFSFDWQSLAGYYERLEAIGLQFNVATLTGHSTLRAGLVKDWQNPQPAELAGMKRAMQQSMGEGALGLSTGLIYAPGCFADTGEIVELAKIAATYGGVYASHMRDERDKLEEAIEETLSIGEQAGINVLVSHLKAAERRNFGKLPAVLARLEAYNRTHTVQAKIDVYPYTAASTKLRAFVPKKLLAGGIEQVPERLRQAGVEEEIAGYIKARGYDLNQMLFISNDHPQWEGKTIAEIAATEGWSLAKTMIELLVRDTEVWIIYFCMDEADMDAAICWPDAMICTDSWSHPINAPHRIGIPHPRSYGAFTQFIYDYVKIKKRLTFQEAVRKISSMPADYFNLYGRGRISEGLIADLNLIDLEALKPKATYTAPLQLSEGIAWVWVNGKAIIEDKVINETKPGVIIKNQQVS